MKSRAADRAVPQPPGVTARRNLLIGAGAAGVAAVGLKSLPLAPVPATSAVARAEPDPTGGYQLTQHVLRYYQTAKV